MDDMLNCIGKDYTISCRCGLEVYEQKKREAFAAAKEHRRQCPLIKNFPHYKVFVDESLDGELDDVWWTF